MTRIITPFKPLGVAESQDRLRRFVDHFRPQAALIPHVSNFDENAWDLRGLVFQASHGNSKIRARFTKLAAGKQERAIEPFGEPFLSFAKAYTLHLLSKNNWSSHGPLSGSWIPVLRFVEHELSAVRPTEPPCITALTEDVCEAVNATIRDRELNPSLKSGLCNTLNKLVTDLQDLGLCTRRFTWKGMVGSYERHNQKVGPEGDRAREAMLPSVEAMGALAYCFSIAERKRDKWVSSINAILSPRPARIGECWFLREDYSVDFEIQGQKRFGLKWWPQKKAKSVIKEFLADDPFVPVIRKAFASLIEISAPARAIAKWYEVNPGRIYLPPDLEYLRGKTMLTMAEVAAIRGVTAESVRALDGWFRTKGFSRRFDPASGNRIFLFEDLERAVLSELPQGFPWFDRKRNLKYSDALILIRIREFHSHLQPSPTMFALPSAGYYYRALDAMMDEHGMVEKDGSPIRLRSHQLRHKLETVAYSKGVARAWMNTQAGRARTSQEERYDNRTDAEMVTQTSVVSVRRNVYGEVVAFEPNRPKTYDETLADIEAAKRTGYAHITDKGCCVHNFVDKPCTEFRDCMFCDDLICFKGIPEWDRNILAACNTEEANFLHATEALENGMYGVREHIEGSLLPRVLYSRQVKKLLDNPEIPPFTFFKHALKADPYDPVVNGMRLHIELGRKEGRDGAWLEMLERAIEKLQGIRSQRREVSFLDGGEV